MGSPPRKSSRLGVSAVTVISSPGRKTRSLPLSKLTPAISMVPSAI